MNNKQKEKLLAKLDPGIFAELPPNYDAIMAAVSEVSTDIAIGKPKKITTRLADPEKGLGEAGYIYFEPGEGIKWHAHDDDTETYTYEDGEVETVKAGYAHCVYPSVISRTVKFDKRPVDKGSEK